MMQRPWTASEELTEAVSLTLQRLAVLSDEDLIDFAFRHFKDVSLTESLILLELFSRVSPDWEARELLSRKLNGHSKEAQRNGKKCGTPALGPPMELRQAKRAAPVLARGREK
jgi:hypothetical protein